MDHEDMDMQSESPKKLAYDPDQDPEEKRKVRREYRSLHKDTEGIPSVFFRQNWALKLGYRKTDQSQ